MTIKGNIIKLETREIFFGEINISKGKIKEIVRLGEEDKTKEYLMPGFIDAHIHIESSMLVPSAFARLAVVHGSVATISDPHEIANVLGMDGVKYMIEDSRKVPFKFNFGAPSCVPATSFETAGAVIDSQGIKELMAMPEIKYLAEMMNYPGVLFDDAEVMAKIQISHDAGKPVDGHAPGLRGDDVKKYIAAGITTDHECFTYDEAKEKLELGMKVLIREGSAAKNFEALIDLLAEYPEMIMFCSDDKHPDDLILGHINLLVKRALAKGHDFFDVLRASSYNIKEHYKLDEVGMLNEGDAADFIIVDNTKDFNVLSTYIDGELVAYKGQTNIEKIEARIVNNFLTSAKTEKQFKIKAEGSKLQVIEALEGELITKTYMSEAVVEDGFVMSNTKEDVLKMAVINRYENVEPALAFIKGFNLKEGAIASCVGHDSHNIIAVGVDDASITKAVNLLIENKGGISAVSNSESKVLPLPIAGIMTQEDGYTVAQKYSTIDQFTKDVLGGTLNAPFMTLSFMALLVIPQLKLSDKGLFDGGTFQFTPLFVD